VVEWQIAKDCGTLQSNAGAAGKSFDSKHLYFALLGHSVRSDDRSGHSVHRRRAAAT
jgi:hypothetical protein